MQMIRRSSNFGDDRMPRDRRRWKAILPRRCAAGPGLLEERRFGNGVLILRYGVRGGASGA
jgi:hypothetical protein